MAVVAVGDIDPAERRTIPGIVAEYRYANELIPGIALSEVNAAVRAAIPVDPEQAGDLHRRRQAGRGAAEGGRPGGHGQQLRRRSPSKPNEEKVYASQLMPALAEGGQHRQSDRQCQGSAPRSWC
jgi:zinc protease